MQNIVDFHDDPSARVLFATDAGGVGLNLQRAASACVLLELPWNPAVLEQRVGRIHRLGQEEPVDVYALVSRGGIEERIAALVGDKQALFRGVFDGGSDEVLFDRSGSFLGDLRRIVESKASATPAPDRSDGQADSDSELDQAPVAPAMAAVEQEPALERSVPATDSIPSAPPEPGARDHSLAAPQIARLLSSMQVERTPSGGLRLEAPSESADVLIALLEGLAGALRAVH